MLRAAEVSGVITRSADATPVANVRITLFRPDLRFFREVRTAADGRYAFGAVPAGTYLCGAAGLCMEYLESSLDMSRG